tara:strand:- start:329 stop:820 length:492 start_codon:yes stop_codon:yes gene_type:complete
MASGTNYRNDVYAPNLKAGVEFQDFVCIKLHSVGIVLQNLSSQKYQLKSENLLGLEIKLDRKFRGTGNLYIETHEKSDPDNPRYVLSGIYRDDETWLYGIGDMKTFYIFAKSTLRNFESYGEKLPWIGRPRPTRTSKGFLIPLGKAREWAARVVDFTDDSPCP